MTILSFEERQALARVAFNEGRRWRTVLREAWACGSYRHVAGIHDAPHLQAVRNRFGPAWLARYKPEPLSNFSEERK